MPIFFSLIRSTNTFISADSVTPPKDKLEEYAVEEKYIEPTKAQFMRMFNAKIEQNNIDLPKFKTRLSEIEGKLEAILERFATGEIDRDLYLKFKKKYGEEKQTIQSEMDTMTFDLSNLEKRLDKYCRILVKPSQTWETNGYRGKL